MRIEMGMGRDRIRQSIAAVMFTVIVAVLGMVVGKPAMAQGPEDGVCNAVASGPTTMTVTCSWADKPNDDHYATIVDGDSVSVRIDGLGVNDSSDPRPDGGSVVVPYGSYQWDTFNVRFGRTYDKNDGSFTVEAPPTTTTTAPDNTTTTAPTTTTTGPGQPTTTTTTPDQTTTTNPDTPPTNGTTPPTTIPPVSTPSSLPFTGPEDDVRELGVLGGLGLIAGIGLVLFTVKGRRKVTW